MNKHIDGQFILGYIAIIRNETENDMKRNSWEWADSKQKRATKIMWDTQGQDFDTVCALIMDACNVDLKAARALYRKLAREEMVAEGFVPAPAKLGRPRKDGSAPVSRIVQAAEAAPVIVHEPEPEPERTETGERKSIADMKAYLAELKKKAGAQ